MNLNIEHPVISRINATGYPFSEQQSVGNDYFGNEVFAGDEILVLDDEFFLKEALFEETIEVLKLAGACETFAK